MSKQRKKNKQRVIAEDTQLTVQESDELMNAALDIAMRASVSARLGKSYGGDRDIYEALGYDKSPSFNDFMARYRRQDIATAVIDRPVDATWDDLPSIKDDDDSSAFNNAWQELARTKNILHYFQRVDRLASIGRFAVLYIGLDDGEKNNTPVTAAEKLLYLQVYSESAVEVKTEVKDAKNPNYGLPEIYSIGTRFPTGKNQLAKPVHYTRLLHVAENLLEHPYYGIPRLECILNRLHDLELIVGGSAEMYWRGAYPGLNFAKDPEVKVRGQSKDELVAQIESYVHGFKRYLRTTGIDVQTIQQQVADPGGPVSVEIDMIAAASRIPKRILMGSERGELASSQDKSEWNDVVRRRRNHFAETTILRPFVDRMISLGILPEPIGNGYDVMWPDLATPSELSRAEVASKVAQALKFYVESEIDMAIPLDLFLTKYLNWSDEEITQAEQTLGDLVDLGGRVSSRGDDDTDIEEDDSDGEESD